jgi:hypothetical protein
MKYQILSPDGFSINVDGGFKTKKAAMDFYEEWKRGYSTQGYYSSVNYGRIPLEDLDDYCQFVKHGREKVC